MNIKPEPVDIEVKLNPAYAKGYKVKETLLDLKQWRKIPVSEEWINGLAFEIVKWGEKEDSLVWEDFYAEYGITSGSLYYLEGRYPLIKEAKDHTRMIIAARRDRLAFRMKASGSVFLGTQAYHSLLFKNFKKEEASWKKEDAQKSGTFSLNFYDQPEPGDASGSDNTNTSK